MEIKREGLVNKPIEAVWEVLGNQYAEAYKWASGLYHSEGSGLPKLAGATCNNRTCDTSFGQVIEEIRVFDPDTYRLSYEVMEGFPEFVKSGINNWSLTAEGNRTRVQMHLKIETQGIVGLLMGPMMKMQMNGVTRDVLEDFRHYVETGQPSPKKEQEEAKRRKKARRKMAA